MSDLTPDFCFHVVAIRKLQYDPEPRCAAPTVHLIAEDLIA